MPSSHWRDGFAVGVVALAWVIAPHDAAAQQRWTVEPQASIAWWQVDPHLNHLWATTCPQDPSWRPGQDHSGGTRYDYTLELPQAGFTNAVDTIPMPAYPRRSQAEPVCPEAVSGSMTVADPEHWAGIQGEVRILGEALRTGNTVRDGFMHRSVLATQRYRHISFRLDSVTGVQTGDTLRGTFHGVLHVLGTARPFSGPAEGWMEGDNLRVQARMKMLARDLVEVYGVSEYAMGLAVSGGIWRWLFLGVDLLLAPAE
jgi:polyisoprenoid-binding protein YceI